MHSMLVRGLVGRGLDVRTALDCGMINRSDEEHLQYAASSSRVLFSYNVADYCRLHDVFLRSGRTHAGILLAAQQRLSVGEQMRGILAFVHRVAPQEMKSRLEFLSRWFPGR